MLCKLAHVINVYAIIFGISELYIVECMFYPLMKAPYLMRFKIENCLKAACMLQGLEFMEPWQPELLIEQNIFLPLYIIFGRKFPPCFIHLIMFVHWCLV